MLPRPGWGGMGRARLGWGGVGLSSLGPPTLLEPMRWERFVYTLGYRIRDEEKILGAKFGI